MSIKVRLMAPGANKEYHSQLGPDGKPILITESTGAIEGTFKSQEFAAAGTYEIISAKGDSGIVLTDLIVSAEKKNVGSVSVIMTDGVDSETLYLGTTTDAPINFGISFNGNWAGWRATYLNVVVAADVIGSVSVGYYRTNRLYTMSRSEWVAQQ